jgi:putative ATP-binding cassette transporter
MIALGPWPFLPQGSLRQVLAFPEAAEHYDNPTLQAALSSVGLAHLADRLDEIADWARVLTAAETQRLSFARIIVFRPRWILMGDATAALDPASADLMLRLIVERLPQAGIILIGRHPGSAEIFSRRLTLEKAADGEILLQEVHARRQAARQPRPRLLSFIDRLRQGYAR